MAYLEKEEEWIVRYGHLNNEFFGSILSIFCILLITITIIYGHFDVLPSKFWGPTCLLN